MMAETEISGQIDRPAPRVLLIDMTRIGDATATGELKATLFADWPRDAIMQLHVTSGEALGVYLNGRERNTPLFAIEKLAQDFDPEVVLYRPAPRTAELHHTAMRLIDRLRTPLVTWIMDDWPTAYSAEDPAAATKLLRDWRKLLSRSVARLSISDAMSGAFKARYGYDFTAIANGVDPADWPDAVPNKDDDLKVRYAGSLAENMTLHSIVKVAQAVEQLAEGGVGIQFEIKTRELWRRIAEPQLKDLKHTRFIVADLQPVEYRTWLSGADISVIAYNFDERSKSYIQYSLANKLPECLASGAPLLAIGPSDVATISALEKYDAGLRVTENSSDAIFNALKTLAAAPERRREIGEKGQQIAFQHFNVIKARQKMSEVLTASARETARENGDFIEEERDVGAHVDETAVVARLLSNRRGRGHVMIDVGAHVGTSAAYFHKLGWAIHCFEPDAKNRTKLKERFAGVDTVSIDPRAVSDSASRGVAFFTSQESTGISGLSAFRETHEETGRVDVTTIADIIREHRIATVDFLKIDVEGFDFSVLKGSPWAAMHPDVIECEFEDAKTKPMGHSWRDIAAYLAEKNYTVYISEWHPIIRYGIPHDWRRVIPFNENTEVPGDAWGNLLAFKQDPGLNQLRATFSALRKYRNGDVMKVKSKSGLAGWGASQNSAAYSRPFYAEFAEKIQQRAPRLFSIAQLFKRALAGMWRRRLMMGLGALVVGVMFFVGLVQPPGEGRLAITGGAVLFAVISMIFYLGSWTYHRVRTLSNETASLHAALASKGKDEGATAATYEAGISDLDKQVLILQSQIRKIITELDARAAAADDVEQTIAEMDEGLHSLETDLAAAQNTGSDAKAQIETLRQRCDELNNAVNAVRGTR